MQIILIVQKSNLILIKMIFVQIDIYQVYFSLFKDLLYNCYITRINIIIINQDIIQINNYKDIKHFGQNLIDIVLKACRYIQ